MHATTRSAENTLLLFGPQIPRLVPSRLAELRRTIQEDPKLEFLVRIAQDLPTVWATTIQPSSPRFGRLTGARQQLEQLGAFLKSDAAEVQHPLGAPSCNLLLAPLTVISQIAEYVRLGRQGPVQGFCVGFLAAAAVASAQDRTELEQRTATAARLAVCIGAIIDLDEQERSNGHPTSPNNSSTWSVRWTSTVEREHLDKTLASSPDVIDHQASYRYSFFAYMVCRRIFHA